MELEYKANMPIAEVGQLLLGEFGGVNAIDTNGTAVWLIQRTDNL